MPYKSEAQRKYFNANRSKLSRKGVDVDEWNRSSEGLSLPEKKSPAVKKSSKGGKNKAPRKPKKWS